MCIITALMLLFPGRTLLLPCDIVPREVDDVGAVHNKLQAA